jgi:hypothetical protein
VKERISYTIFVDDGYPEADEFSNNYVEHRHVEHRVANDTGDARISHVAIVPGWFQRQVLRVREVLSRVSAKAAGQR